MKALTLHQPWASLIAVGVKTIETRSWGTNHRGPIAIHAGKTEPGHSTRVGEFTTYRADSPYYRSGNKRPGAMPARMWRDDRSSYTELPLGAVVCVANLVDVLQMVDLWPTGDDKHGKLYVPNAPNRMCWWPSSPDKGGHECEEQRPYGDFRSGRYAWILEDVEPVVPVPARGRQGLWNW